MKYAVPVMLLLLAACGADGPPTYPDQPATGITMSGEARIGVRTDL